MINAYIPFKSKLVPAVDWFESSYDIRPYVFVEEKGGAMQEQAEAARNHCSQEKGEGK